MPRRPRRGPRARRRSPHPVNGHPPDDVGDPAALGDPGGAVPVQSPRRAARPADHHRAYRHCRGHLEASASSPPERQARRHLYTTSCSPVAARRYGPSSRRPVRTTARLAASTLPAGSPSAVSPLPSGYPATPALNRHQPGSGRHAERDRPDKRPQTVGFCKGYKSPW